MTEQPYTEADVRLVGDALDTYYAAMGMPPSYRPYGAAKVALDALGGRLLPEGASTASCGCVVQVQPVKVTRHTRECSSRQAGEQMAAHLRADGLLPDDDLVTPPTINEESSDG